MPDDDVSAEVPVLMDLGDRARAGARLTFVTQAAMQLGSILATVAMARLLTPMEFGLVAAVQTVMGVGAFASAAALTTSLVTRRGDVARLASTYFWALAGIGSAIAALVALGAEPLMQLFGLPEARWLLVVLVVSLPLTLVVQIPQALLQRDLDFRRLTIATVVPALVFFVCEVALAASGFGPWAVVWGQVLSAVVGLGLTLVLARWLPGGGMAFGKLREDLGLVGGVSLSSVFAYLYKNVDYWGVGRGLGADSLGRYYIAYVLPNILRVRLSGIFRVVLLPVLAKAPDAETRRAHWRRALLVTFFVGAPTLAGIAAIGRPLVEIFFGDQWNGVVRPMQILMLGSVVDIVVNAVGTIAVSERKVARHTTLLGVRVVLTLVGVLLALLLAPTLTGMACAVTAAALASLVVQHVIVSRPLALSLRPIAADLLLVVVMTTAMGLVAAVVTHELQGSHAVLQIAAAVPAGIVTYLGTGVVLSRSRTTMLVRECRLLVGR
ncbi:oligosaccharide flippase family protein [Knoellia sp. CPCC 206435]|uniref:oligosaccharide flippase family protein n=1 Tax=Knoellia terrae TaxID=3404797 RepID=UPI003B433DB6